MDTIIFYSPIKTEHSNSLLFLTTYLQAVNAISSIFQRASTSFQMQTIFVSMSLNLNCQFPLWSPHFLVEGFSSNSISLRRALPTK